MRQSPLDWLEPWSRSLLMSSYRQLRRRDGILINHRMLLSKLSSSTPWERSFTFLQVRLTALNTAATSYNTDCAENLKNVELKLTDTSDRWENLCVKLNKTQRRRDDAELILHQTEILRISLIPKNCSKHKTNCTLFYIVSCAFVYWSLKFQFNNALIILNVVMVKLLNISKIITIQYIKLDTL